MKKFFIMFAAIIFIFSCSNRNANDMRYVIDNNAIFVTNVKGFNVYKFYNK